MKGFSLLLVKTVAVAMLGIAALQWPSAHAESGTPAGWKAIAVGTTHSLAIKEDGTVWQWGDITTYGASGVPETNLTALIPEQVPGLHDVIAVAGGQVHSLALESDGTVWSWGGNGGGMVGDGTEDSRPLPKQVEVLTDVVAIEADWTRSFAVKADGSVWGWGGFYYEDADGEFRHPDVPVQLVGLQGITAISSGYGSFVALKKDGTVWQRLDTMTQLPGIQDIVQVAVGAEFTYGLKRDGTVWFWGSDGIGTAGGVSVDNDSAARMLEGARDVVAIQASAGGPLLLKKDGTVWASGVNSGGQLGIGSFKSSDKLVQVIGLKKIKTIAAHGLGVRSMAIRADGTLWSWGIGYNGDGSKGYKTTPVGVASYANEMLEKDPIFVQINGKTLRFDQPPVNLNNRTMVPLRAIFEAMGAELKWEAATSTITARKGSTTIVLRVGNAVGQVNNAKVKLDTPPAIIGNRALVPLRFIGEALGAKVGWDGSSKTVSIATAA
ncbi:hypothetical protein GZH47_11395 [Paenibacillus rhizovicinus]|uniref:Copper amine oxidase-like N-terminal domain-containing protein n=1 Tax=Paenibacillus rhizovicinus TaxID=2704463 RepID=A0A6C0NZL9_9BACL|nr:stalk domain-containing protein [Paenibacillus rhizovicinus]QHW31386.1 hypothetical protein GZH47_11395 [Paenibacillus rhizovicinus]